MVPARRQRRAWPRMSPLPLECGWRFCLCWRFVEQFIYWRWRLCWRGGRQRLRATRRCWCSQRGLSEVFWQLSWNGIFTSAWR
eukprot:5891866-Pyramimonas_sp.AAC.1